MPLLWEYKKYGLQRRIPMCGLPYPPPPTQLPGGTRCFIPSYVFSLQFICAFRVKMSRNPRRFTAQRCMSEEPVESYRLRRGWTEERSQEARTFFGAAAGQGVFRTIASGFFSYVQVFFWLLPFRTLVCPVTSHVGLVSAVTLCRRIGPGSGTRQVCIQRGLGAYIQGLVSVVSRSHV